MTTTLTASAPSEFDVARETGAQHAEHLCGLLDYMPSDRKPALIEGARIRLGSFIAQQIPADAPAQKILDVAFTAFHDVIKSANHKESK